jgi:hypothetical protein
MITEAYRRKKIKIANYSFPIVGLPPCPAGREMGQIKLIYLTNSAERKTSKICSTLPEVNHMTFEAVGSTLIFRRRVRFAKLCCT